MSGAPYMGIQYLSMPLSLTPHQSLTLYAQSSSR